MKDEAAGQRRRRRSIVKWGLIATAWTLIGLSHALDYYRKYCEHELRAPQLETRFAQAEPDALGGDPATMCK
jgi:hypothetical protein